MSRTFDLSADANLAAAIDLLVADELASDDRQALLLKLEASNDGWRRCALAFLEDQAWRTALPAYRSAAASPIEQHTFISTKRSWSSVRYVLAASLLLLSVFAAYRAGIAAAERATLLDDRTSTGPVVANPKLPSQPKRPLDQVMIGDPAAGESSSGQVPTPAVTAANERWLLAQPATISEYVKAQWERRGYRVEEHHRLINLDLDDGRRVAVPVAEVAVDFVGRQPL